MISMTVKEKDIDRLNKIYAIAVPYGATVSNLYFEVEDKDSAVDEARQIAVKKAKEKAGKIAGEVGIKLGRVLNVTEYYPNDYMAPYGGEFGKGAGGGGGVTEIKSGQTEVKVNVTLTYETL